MYPKTGITHHKISPAIFNRYFPIRIHCFSPGTLSDVISNVDAGCQYGAIPEWGQCQSQGNTGVKEIVCKKWKRRPNATISGAALTIESFTCECYLRIALFDVVKETQNWHLVVFFILYILFFLTPDLPWLWYCPDALTLVLSRTVKLTTVRVFTPLFWKSWFQRYHADIIDCV